VTKQKPAMDDPASGEPPVFQGVATVLARERPAGKRPNASPESGPPGPAAAVLEVIREPMFLLPIAAAGICLVLGDLHEALLLLFAGVAMGIALYPSHKTERALQALREVFGFICLHASDALPALVAGTAGIVPFERTKGERLAAPVSWR